MSVLDVTIWKYTVKNFLEYQKHFANPISLVSIPVRPYQPPNIMSHNCSYEDHQWPQLCRSKNESLKLIWFLLSAFCTVDHALLLRCIPPSPSWTPLSFCSLPTSLTTRFQSPMLISCHEPDAAVPLMIRHQTSFIWPHALNDLNPVSWF